TKAPRCRTYAWCASIKAEERHIMMTTWMRRMSGAAAVLLLAATAAPSLDRQPMVVSSLAGTLNVQQNIPCGGHINETTTVNGGRLELTPSDGVDVVGGKIFSLARGTV